MAMIAPRMMSASLLPWLVVLAAIWVPVVYLLGAQWWLMEDYQYGWAVPFMCLYLAESRFSTLPPASVPARRRPAVFLLGAAALVYSVMRVLQEANPLWRLASYGLALAAVVMTLLAIYLTQGAPRAWHFIFPIAFFVVAVPWPSVLENRIIQSLTGFNTSLAVEALNFAGLPALQQGNVIEISAGKVGINEACSGIRSFQATLMIALFFGEFYRLPSARRWRLVAVGPLLAMAFNLARTLVLVFVAALAGLPVMEKWHDLTGEVLMVACFLCLWGVAWLLKTKTQGRTATATATPHRSVLLRPMMWVILVWALATGFSTEVWFRSHEEHSNRIIDWAVRWPQENPSLQTNVISQSSLKILQCDQSSSAIWVGDGGVMWRAFFLRWLPSDSFYGRAKEALSKVHNPAVCLPASGLELRQRLDSVSLPVRPGFNLEFERYVFAAGGRDLFVFFSQTEDVLAGGQASSRMTHEARLGAALAGSRNFGQNNFEVAMAGPENAEAALRIFGARLPGLIQIQPARP